MRQLIVAFSVALLAAEGLVAQAPSTAQKKPATAKKSVPATQAKSLAPKTSAAPAPAGAKPTTAVAAHRSTKKPKVVVATRRPQQQPTPERFKEIQQALAERGYFSGPADGNWGPSSIDALKRFQAEQSLVEDGKIGSLSLIALGLGPRRAAPAESAADRQLQQQ